MATHEKMSLRMAWAALLLLILPMAAGVFFNIRKWPISPYPMYSKRKRIEDVVVYRLALEGNSGKVEWWKPRFSYYSRNFGISYSRALRLKSKNPQESADKIERLLKDYLRFIKATQASHHLSRLQVVRRTIASVDRGFRVKDELMEVMNLAQP